MLVLSRKVGQELVIGDNIRITVNRVGGSRVTLGISAPNDVRIVRGELEPIVTSFEVDVPIDEQSQANPCGSEVNSSETGTAKTARNDGGRDGETGDSASKPLEGVLRHRASNARPIRAPKTSSVRDSKAGQQSEGQGGDSLKAGPVNRAPATVVENAKSTVRVDSQHSGATPPVEHDAIANRNRRLH